MDLQLVLALFAAGFLSGVLVAHAWYKAAITYNQAFRLAAEQEAQQQRQRALVLEMQLNRISEQHPELVVSALGRRNGHGEGGK